MKELLKFNQLITCFKNIAAKIKNCKNPFEKMFIIVNEFDTLSSEILTPEYE